MVLDRIVNKLARMQDERFEKRYSRVSAVTRTGTLLIIKPDSIGDYVIFRNYLESMKRSSRFKNYSITLLGNIWYKDLAEAFDSDFIDRFIWVSLDELRNKDAFEVLVKELHREAYEIAICPNYSPTVEDVKLLALCGAREKIGHQGDTLNLTVTEFERYRPFVGTWLGKGRRTDFEFYRYRDFFSSIIGEEVLPQRITLPLAANSQRRIILCPGANSPMRRWSTANFAKLIDHLNLEYPGREIYLVGSAADSDLASEIIQKATTKDINDITGKLDLVELARHIASAELVITNDTGPYHIAMALQLKVICLSNGNNLGRFTPYPVSLSRTSVTLLPTHVLAESQNGETMLKFQSRVSKENIDLITVDMAVKACNKIMNE